MYIQQKWGGGQNEKTLYTMDGSNNSYCFLVFIFSME